MKAVGPLALRLSPIAHGVRRSEGNTVITQLTHFTRSTSHVQGLPAPSDRQSVQAALRSYDRCMNDRRRNLLRMVSALTALFLALAAVLRGLNGEADTASVAAVGALAWAAVAWMLRNPV